MENLNSKTAAVVFIAFTVFAMGLVVYATQSERMGMAPLGESEKNALIQDLAGIDGADSASGVHMRGTQITISEAEFLKIKERYELAGSENAATRAEKFLLWQESICLLAKEAGIAVTDDMVRTRINAQIEEFKLAANYADFQLYLDTLNITIEEYFEKEFENIKKDLYISSYYDLVASEIPAQNSASMALEDTVNAEMNLRSEEFIKGDNVMIIAS